MPKTIHRPEYEVLCRMVREAREQAGMTQGEVSSRLGKTQSFISDIERGTRRLDALELRDLCALFGVDFLSFMKAFDLAAGKLDGGRRRRAGRASSAQSQ